MKWKDVVIVIIMGCNVLLIRKNVLLKSDNAFQRTRMHLTLEEQI